MFGSSWRCLLNAPTRESLSEHPVSRCYWPRRYTCMYNKNGLVRDWGLRAYWYTVAAVYTVFLLVASSYHGRARRQHSSYCFSRSTTAVVATSRQQGHCCVYSRSSDWLLVKTLCRQQLLRTGSRYASILCSVYGYVRVETSHSYRTTVQLYSSDCTDSHHVPTTVCTYVRTIDSNTAVQ